MTKYLRLAHANDAHVPGMMTVQVHSGDDNSHLGQVIISVIDGHLEVAIDTGGDYTVVDVDDQIVYDDGDVVEDEDNDWWSVSDAVGNSVEVIADDAVDALYYATLADNPPTGDSDEWLVKKI